MGSHPTWVANAVAVVLTASCIIFTFTILAAIGSIRSVTAKDVQCLMFIGINLTIQVFNSCIKYKYNVPARNVTVGSHPARCTLTRSADVVAFGPIFTRAILAAMQPVSVLAAGMLAGNSNVSRTADVVPADMITGLIAIHDIRTFLLATQSVETRRTWFWTVLASPPFVADTFTSLCVAGRIVIAPTDVFAFVAITAWRTFRFTIDTWNDGLLN